MLRPRAPADALAARPPDPEPRADGAAREQRPPGRPRVRSRRGRALEVDTVIRYVDSSGWTWEVCEVARDLDPEDGAVEAPDSGTATLAATPPRKHPRDSPLTDGPAELRPIPRADLADGASGAGTDPFGDDGALYFLSRLGTRKLRHYPPSWHELPRTELEALCWSAEIV